MAEPGATREASTVAQESRGGRVPAQSGNFRWTGRGTPHTRADYEMIDGKVHDIYICIYNIYIYIYIYIFHIIEYIINLPIYRSSHIII